MTDTPSDYTADPLYRLSVAKELLRCVLDPHDLGTKVCGPDYLKGRIHDFLTAEGEQGMGPAEAAARAAVAALRIPWPHLATGGLEPGDRVTHPALGEGALTGYTDEEWPSLIPVVTAGHVRVQFGEQIGRVWVPAGQLARLTESVVR